MYDSQLYTPPFVSAKCICNSTATFRARDDNQQSNDESDRRHTAAELATISSTDGSKTRDDSQRHTATVSGVHTCATNEPHALVSSNREASFAMSVSGLDPACPVPNPTLPTATPGNT